MIKIADKPNEPKYRNQFVLTANGYHGDMDYDFHLEEAVEAGQDPPQQEELDWLCDGYRELKQLYDKYKATRNGTRCRDVSFKSDLVPCDEYGEWYPTVQSFALTYYNADGIGFDVEVDDVSLEEEDDLPPR